MRAAWSFGKGLGAVIGRRETFAAGMHLIGEAVEDCRSGCVSTYGRALEDQRRAGLGEGPGSEDKERAPCTVGSLAETEPGGKRDAVAVLGRRRGEIEYKRRKTTSLEKEISGAQGLIEGLEARGKGVGAE
jgi:hypothetical protein